MSLDGCRASARRLPCQAAACSGGKVDTWGTLTETVRYWNANGLWFVVGLG